MLSANCNVVSPSIPLQYPVPIQVTLAYMCAVTLTDAWEQKLTDIVEKICSRQPTGRGQLSIPYVSMKRGIASSVLIAFWLDT